QDRALVPAGPSTFRTTGAPQGVPAVACSPVSGGQLRAMARVTPRCSSASRRHRWPTEVPTRPHGFPAENLAVRGPIAVVASAGAMDRTPPGNVHLERLDQLTF